MASHIGHTNLPVNAFLTSDAQCSADCLVSKILNDSEFKFGLLIEHIPAITYIAAMDEASSTLYTSPQIERILGFSQSEWISDNRLWFKQVHSDDQGYVLSELSRIRAGGDPIPCEYRMFTCDRREVWFCDHSAIYRDSCGKPVLLYGVMLDITERKRLENELVITKCRLSETQKQKLSAREMSILKLMRAGLSDRAIGEAIAVSERTVRYCLQELRKKFSVNKRFELIQETVRLGLLEE